MTTGKTASVTDICSPHNICQNMKSNVNKWVIQRKCINKHLAHLLRGGKLAEDSSDARLGRTELCGVTEGGNSEDGAEGATLVLLTREGDSCFGVEELDVADGEGIKCHILQKIKQFKKREVKSLMHDTERRVKLMSVTYCLKQQRSSHH